MKKYLVIVMLLCGFNLFSLDHGLISGFEVGYNLNDIIQVDDIIVMNNNGSLYIQLKTGYQIDNFKIIGTYTNTLFQLDIDNYIPVQDRFRIDINYTWGFLTLGGFTFCDHPSVTQADTRSTFVNRGQRAIYIRFYREF